jgi:hypothetical protein
MAETLVKVIGRQRPSDLSTAPGDGGGERVWWCGWGWRLDILLGPEATSMVRVCVRARACACVRVCVGWLVRWIPIGADTAQGSGLVGVVR